MPLDERSAPEPLLKPTSTACDQHRYQDVVFDHFFTYRDHHQ